MEEVTGGMRLALRHWRELAGTTLIFALVCFALSFILGDVIVEVGVLRGGATVRREGATTFPQASKRHEPPPARHAVREDRGG